MELCPSRTVGNAVERAYARSDLLEKRRVLVTQWGSLCAATSTDAPPNGPDGDCPGRQVHPNYSPGLRKRPTGVR